MQNIATVIFLLAVVTALAEVTDKVKIPYPILLVAAGIAMGMIPGLPNITIDPEIIFLVFLPPILYGAAWETSWPDFKAAKRPITLLAIGCVIFTTCAVAWVAHTFIPNFGWAEAFVLGAIVSPPDAVAATAALKGLPVPKRVTTILEGESLVNDATGLIAYRYAVLAVTTGAFSLWAVGTQFLVVATGGIAIGLLCSWIFVWIHKITPDNATNDTVLTFLAPFVAYLGAEAIHLSGVLAVVAAGLYMSQKSSEVYSQETRLQAYGSWDTVMFILNGVIFILIGLQLPEIVSNMGANSFWAWKYAIIISVAVIVGRLIWVYPATYIPRWLSKGIRERETSTNVKLTTIVAWSGMRGVVSLAAALALPLTGAGGADFPHRNLIIFITFSVIFSTLVLQGLTLRPLINVFGIENDGNDHEEEKKARLLIASSIIEHIEENYALGLSDEVLNQIKTKYEMRIQRLRKDDTQRMSEEQIVEFHRLQQELLDKERAEMLRFRRQGVITDEMLRKMEYELDLEETRLILEKTMV
jgi:CPA1 family monovalent cation:H+ antiporter